MSAESEAIWRVCEDPGCDRLAHVRFSRDGLLLCMEHAADEMLHRPRQYDPYCGEAAKTAEVTH